MTIQALLGLGKNGQFLGQTMTAASFTTNLKFNYPTSQAGDLLIAYVVSSDKIVPNPQDGWSTLYSNTVQAVDGTGSGRLLMYKRRGKDSSANVYVSGGGNCTCVSLRGYLGTFENVTEFVANNSIGDYTFTQPINTQQSLITLVNQEGGLANAVITFANTTASYHTEPGFYRSMGVAYNIGVADDPITVNVSSDSAYGVYLTVF